MEPSKKMIEDKDRIIYYFEYLANMSFMARAKEGRPNELVLHKVNQKIRSYMPEAEEALIDKPLRYFIEDIIDDIDIRSEYLQIVTDITDLKKVLEKNKWRFFDVSIVHSDKDHKESDAIFVKSIIPLGVKTKCWDDNLNGPVFVDIFSASQIIKGQFAGIQGMLPIVNERREATILKQKTLELTLFHHLKVDMKKIPVMVDNLLKYDNTLSENATATLKKIKNYSDTVVGQADKILGLFHKYVSKTVNSNDNASTDGKGSPPPNKIENFEQYGDLLIERFKQEVEINFIYNKNVKKYFTTLFSDVFEFIALQFITNAIKEYEREKIPFQKRQIKITFSKVDNPDSLQITFTNSNTCLPPLIVDNAGIKPFKTDSSGLGFYFLNYVLEMFKALKPNPNNRRFFELSTSCEEPKYVEMLIHFPINEQ